MVDVDVDVGCWSQVIYAVSFIVGRGKGGGGGGGDAGGGEGDTGRGQRLVG